MGNEAATTAPGAQRRIGGGIAFASILLLAAAYLPAMQGEFLMSDVRVIVENPRLIGFDGLLSVWSATSHDRYPVMDQYQPLSYSLLWFERGLFGLEPRAYQLLSLALHALNAFLVWRLLLRIGVRGAAVAAAVFALHPVHVESVAWIYEQKNLLSGACFFLALLAYLNFSDGRGRSWYAASLALFAGALLAKSSTVVLPVLLVLLYAWYRREPPWRWKTLAPTLPFFGMGALMAAVTLWHEGAVTGAAGELYSAGALERAIRPGWVLGFHAGKLLVPTKLAFFYPRWSIDPANAWAYAPLLAIAALLFVAWLRREGWGRPALLGIGWYLVLMFPVSGIFDIYYHQFSLAADHFQYLGSVGLIALCVHAGTTAVKKFSSPDSGSPARGSAAGWIAALLIIGVVWLLAWQRSHVFANEGLLARDSARKYSTSVLAFQKSGEVLLKRAVRGGDDAASQIRQAIEDLEHAAELRPDEPQIHDSLGVAYFLGGRPHEARPHLEIAVASRPGNAMYHKNLAAVLAALNETERALAEYRAVVAAAPNQPTERLALARALIQAKRFNEAAGALEVVIEQATPMTERSRRMAEVARQAQVLRAQVGARLAASTTAPSRAAHTDPPWSVLLVSVDTLRPDYLSFNGYDRITSPALDELLRQGFYFEQAVTPVPRTTPALASLLTGTYPHRSGVRSLGDRLPQEMLTLAEAFRGDGYQTLAVVTNLLLGPTRGLNAGFDVYDSAPDVRDARRTTTAALRHLEAADSGKPLFAWVHYIDPHVPYHPPETFAESFDAGYRGRFRSNFGRQPRHDEPDDLFRAFPDGLDKSSVTHRNPLSAAENSHIRRLYAGEIRELDASLEELIQAVRERFPRSVIVFTADHGESLGEHDFYFDHGDYVYDASSRVPLAFLLPREHPWHGNGRVTGWVSLVDVAPTLFDLVGRAPPPEMGALFEGRSLAPALRGETLPPLPVFVESGTSFYPELVRRRQRNDVAGRFRAVTSEDWKLIWTPFLPDEQAWELFDLAHDPKESRNLYRADHPRAERLKQQLQAWLSQASPGASPARPPSPQDVEALRKLGYIE